MGTVLTTRSWWRQASMLRAWPSWRMAQEAMVAIGKNKRTLRDAREKQKFVKMSRQYRSSD